MNAVGSVVANLSNGQVHTRWLHVSWISSLSKDFEHETRNTWTWEHWNICKVFFIMVPSQVGGVVRKEDTQAVDEPG